MLILTDNQQQTIVNALMQAAVGCRAEADALSRSMGDRAIPAVMGAIAALHNSAAEYTAVLAIIEGAVSVAVAEE